ncbi:MAG: hypothetical protein H0V45_08145 [Actinobacteria bacterium]|nr:hypothetical protein [Actinomycetota bacterium]
MLEVGRGFVVGVSAPRYGIHAATVGLALLLVALGVLLRRADPPERHAAALAAAVGAFSLALPISAALVGLDYVLTRNLIVTWLPFVLLVAIACSIRRAGRLGPAVVASLAMLSLATLGAVATDERLQRVDWRRAAALLGKAPRDRVIVAWGEYRLAPLEDYANALEQLQKGRVVEVSEVDVLGFRRPAGRSSCWSGAACNMSGTLPPEEAPLPGFTEAERQRDGLFELARLRSARPLRVASDELVKRLAQAGAQPRVWLQRTARLP